MSTNAINRKKPSIHKISVYVRKLRTDSYFVGISANGAIVQAKNNLQDIFDFLFYYRELFELFDMKTDYEVKQSDEYIQYKEDLKNSKS